MSYLSLNSSCRHRFEFSSAILFLIVCLLIFSPSPVSAQCQTTTPWNWTIVVLRPANSDGNRIVNAIQLALEQTAISTHALSLPHDRFTFSTSAHVFDDKCTVSAADAESAGSTLANQLLPPTAIINASVIIGGSCSEVDVGIAAPLKSARIPVISYRAFSPLLSNIVTYPNFFRAGLVPNEEALAAYRFLEFHDLFRVGVLCTSDTPNRKFCTDFATLAPTHGVDVLIPSLLPPFYSLSDAAAISSALLQFRDKNYRALILYLNFNTAEHVLRAMFSLGMFGSTYYLMLTPTLQTDLIFNDVTIQSVVNGALMLAPAASEPGFETMRFVNEYTARKFTSGGSDAGVMGLYAYDSVQLFVQAIRSMRSKCVNATDGATLLTHLREAAFDGVTGSFKLVSGTNDRVTPQLYQVINIVGTSFNSVGMMADGKVQITNPIVYPGNFAAPIKQYRVGLLWSNTSLSAPSDYAADAAVPTAVEFALHVLNAATNTESPLFGSKGREQLVMLPSHVAADDCGTTPGLATAAFKTILSLRPPMFIIGARCDSVLSADSSSFLKAVHESKVPFIVYGANSFSFPPAQSLPNVVRISFPKSAETQLLCSIAAFYGWTCTSAAYTHDTIGLSLYQSFATTAASYGIRVPVIFPITAATNDTDFNAFFAMQRSTISATTFAFFGDGLPVDASQRLLQLAFNYTQWPFYGKNQQIIAGGAFSKVAASNAFAMPWKQAAQGIVYTDSSLDLSNDRVRNFTLAWQAATNSNINTIEHVPYVYDAVWAGTKALGTLRTGLIDPYKSPDVFSTALHAVEFIGVLGVVKFTSTSVDRQSSPGFFRVRSYRMDGLIDVIGTNDASGDFIVTKNPYAWPGNVSLPTTACTRGSIGVLSAPSAATLGARYVCKPCAFNQYVLTGGTACTNCSSDKICVSGSWTNGGWDKGIYWNQPNATVLPVQTGSWVSLAEITAFDMTYAFLLAGFVIGCFLIFHVLMRILRDRLEPLLKRIDFFTIDHPVPDNTPLVVRSTALGGFCTILFFFLMVLALTYFGNRYKLNKYVVMQSQELGTTKLVDPSPLSFNLTFISVDNVPECNALCQRSNLMTGVSGTFSCTTLLAETSCLVQFKIDPMKRILPSTFSFTLNYLNSHVHGVHFSASGAKFAGKDYGCNTTVRADRGTVLYGYNASTVINIDLQPYIFNGNTELDPAKAPMFAAGYLAIPNSIYKGPQQEASAAWADLNGPKNNAGAYVTINFIRQNAVASFYLVESTTLMTVFSQCIALAIAMVMYFTRTSMKMIEGWGQFKAELEAASKKTDDQTDLEKSETKLKLETKVTVQTLAEIAQETAAVVSKTEKIRRDLLRAKLGDDVYASLMAKHAVSVTPDPPADGETAIPSTSDGSSESNPVLSSSSSTPAPFSSSSTPSADDAAPVSSSDLDYSVYSSAFPWKSVVNEVVLHCPAKDLAKALAEVPARDTTSMRLMADAFAPYFHQRAMELKPIESSKPSDSSSRRR